MPLYADRAAAPPGKTRAPAAARPQPRKAPPERSPLWHVLQLRAAQSARAEPAAPAAPSASALPAGLRAGVEQLSGIAMDDVRVHRNSSEPARLGALAFARGSDIHLGPGQDRHLPHEAWHVVQQKQGRVGATAQLKGIGLNDSAALEAEADAMGARAALAPALPESALQRRSALNGAVQRKKLAPAVPQQLCPQPVADGEIDSPDATTPKLWKYKITDDVEAAGQSQLLQRLAAIQGGVGAHYEGKTWLATKAHDEWLVKDGKQARGLDRTGLNALRNDQNLPLIDPVAVEVTTKLADNKGSMRVRVQYANAMAGYITAVTDTTHGLDHELVAGKVADHTKLTPGNKLPFSQIHEKDKKSVETSLLNITSQSGKKEQAAAADAITKLVGEGGRFEPVRTLGQKVSDDSVFFAKSDADNSKYTGMTFKKLYVNWGKLFNLKYNVPTGTVKTVVAAQTAKVFTGGKLSLQGKISFQDNKFEKDAAHFNLETGQAAAGEVYVVPPPPQPVVVAPVQQPAQQPVPPQQRSWAQRVGQKK
jgi:hypothetical protein